MSRPISEAEKAQSRSISLLPTLWAKVEAKAGSHAGARSDYIRRLIEADLAPEGRTEEGVLTALARLHAPAAFETFATHPVASDRDTQRWLLAYLLLAYAQAVAHHGDTMPVGPLTVKIEDPMRDPFRAVAEPSTPGPGGPGKDARKRPA